MHSLKIFYLIFIDVNVLGENVHLSPAGKRRTSSSEESSSYVSLKQFTNGSKYSPFFLVTIIVCIACIAILVLVILLVTTMQVIYFYQLILSDSHVFN